MKQIQRIPLIALMVAIGFTANAQIKKGNKHIKYFNYAKAIPYFLKVVESGDGAHRFEATQKLADCYRMVNDVGEAERWYKQVLTFPQADPVNYFHWGNALRSLGQYDEAAAAYKRFNTLLPDTLDGEKFYRYAVDIKEWLELPDMAEIKNAAALNTEYADFGPSFYKNGIVFTSDRRLDVLDNTTYGWTNFNYLDLYFSRPEYSGVFWSAMSDPESMTHRFNQSFHDGPVSFANGDKTIYSTRTLKKEGKKDDDNIRTYLLKIFSAELGRDKKLKFMPFFLNSREYSVAHPTLSKNGDMIIFSSDMPGGYGKSDIYKCVLEGGQWSDPVNLGEKVNTKHDEVFPFLANDSVLFFSSDGHMGYGGLDILRVPLKDIHQAMPENVKHPINSSYDDFGIILTSALTDGFFCSNRPEGMGSDDIYAFKDLNLLVPTMVPPPPKKLRVSGKVKTYDSGEPVSGATVFLLNALTDEVLVLKTDAEGVYEAQVDEGTFYFPKAMKKGYIFDCTSFKTPSLASGLPVTNPRDLLLGKYQVNKAFTVENIYYDLDKWFIRDDARPPLDKLVALMKQYPISAELSSHTDSRASHGYNTELSQKRAESAVRYIILQGINPARITARGYGETRLVNECSDGVRCSEAQHQDNRRTEFEITSIDAPGATDDFDPDRYDAGQVISLKMLGVDFFDKCMTK